MTNVMTTSTNILANISEGEPRQPGPPKGSPKVPGSGRKKGTPNRVTRQVREIACKYTARAVRQAWKLATEAKNQETQLKALELILAYGHGRPPQVQLLGGTGEEPVQLQRVRDGMRDNPRELARRLECMLTTAGLDKVVAQALSAGEGVDKPALEPPKTLAEAAVVLEPESPAKARPERANDAVEPPEETGEPQPDVGQSAWYGKLEVRRRPPSRAISCSTT